VSDDEATPRSDRRQWLIQADHTASRDFDRTVVALSAGALGLSIVFVQNIAPQPVHKEWLAIAWGLFAASLIANLASFLTSQHALRWEMRHFDEEVETAGGWLGKTTIGLNWCSAVAFILGVIALVTFAYLNL
jgi:hypothetical protein